MQKNDRLIIRQRSHYRGRGALSNRQSRFLASHSEIDDGPASPQPVTEYRMVDASRIITVNRSPDVPFEQSINPYQGCEHGCIYCYARPTHAYLGLSPGLDFETHLIAKRNAPELLRTELAKAGYHCRPIALGANTDPYQPLEKELHITRQLLTILHQCQHPLSIITKSALISRDIGLLSELASEGLVSVAISVTTLDDKLKRLLEPRAPSAYRRLQVIEQLSTAGIPVSVLAAPMIPAINDVELEQILSAAASAGASRAGYILLRLPLELRDLFDEWLWQHFPLRAQHVWSLIRQNREGRDSSSRFGERMRGCGPLADLLSQRFRLSCKKLRLDMGPPPTLRCDLFKAPVLIQNDQHSGQYDLFA
ncbi:MAG: PA0069 family radical SAM protein [Parahaliea sp.]